MGAGCKMGEVSGEDQDVVQSVVTLGRLRC